MMTIEKLYEIMQTQQEEIECLNKELKALREWSDLNDFYLREMIDALTETVDELTENHCCCEKYRERHEAHRLEKKKAKEASEEI